MNKADEHIDEGAVDPQIDVSVVVPVFSSPGTLQELFDRVRAVLEGLGKRFEVIFVHDGGEKACWNILKKIKAAAPDLVTAIRLSRNFGQHNATLCGIDHSRGKWIITIDDDLQTPPEEIAALLKCGENSEADVVYGLHQSRKDSLFRRLGSRFFKAVLRYMARGLRDGSSFRLIRRELGKQIGEHREQFVFLDQIISWYTLQIEYVQVGHEARREGRSGYSGMKLIRMAVKIIFLYTDLPLRMMIWAGLLGSIVSLGAGALFIILKLVNDAQVGFTALITAIFFSASIILLSLGILGEYIGRIYAARTDRPVYAIKKIL